MFFGEMKEEGEVIQMRDTTMVAAKTFFHFIYKKPGEVPIENMSMKNIFHLYKLADSYGMIDLMETVKDAVKGKELTNENVMEVAAVAEKYLIVFEDISKELHKRCGNFLAKSLNIFPAIQEFLTNDNKDFDADLFRKLVIQAEKVIPKIPHCQWCLSNGYGDIAEAYPMQDFGATWHCPNCGSIQSK